MNCSSSGISKVVNTWVDSTYIWELALFTLHCLCHWYHWCLCRCLYLWGHWCLAVSLAGLWVPSLFLQPQVVSTAAVMGTRVLGAAPTGGTAEVAGATAMVWYLGCGCSHSSWNLRSCALPPLLLWFHPLHEVQSAHLQVYGSFGHPGVLCRGSYVWL